MSKRRKAYWTCRNCDNSVQMGNKKCSCGRRFIKNRKKKKGWLNERQALGEV
jgi:hypothetical protein